MCDKPAQAVCDCNPDLVYLCKGCVGGHWNTQGAHQVTSLEILPDATSSTLSSALDRRKKITLVKSFLSERLRQIRREHLEYTARLENMERSLHESVTNKFRDLASLLDLSMEKLEKEVLLLQLDIQGYHEGQDKVSPVCSELLSQAQSLNCHLSVPVGSLLTNIDGLETQISNLQGFNCQGLNVLIAGALPSSALYYFTDLDESLVVFDPETKTASTKLIPYDGILSFDSSWCSLQSGDLFICGGSGNMEKLGCANCLSLATFTLQPCDDMLIPRSSHGVIQFKEEIFVFGGEGSSGSALPFCECTTLQEPSWTQKARMEQGLTKVNLTIFKEVIYISGYNTYKIYVYFPTKDSYRPITFAFNRSFLSSCLLNISKDKTDRILILRGNSTIICEPQANYDLKSIHSVDQHNPSLVWETKGSPVQVDTAFYVFNFHMKCVFEVFVVGTRVDVVEVMREEE